MKPCTPLDWLWALLAVILIAAARGGGLRALAGTERTP